MKDTKEFVELNQKFINVIDYIIFLHKRLGIKPANFGAIGKLIYPANRGIVSAVRNKKKHVPHLAIINLAKYFDIDMNYFYKSSVPIKYIPSKEVGLDENNALTLKHVCAEVQMDKENKNLLDEIRQNSPERKNDLQETVFLNNMIKEFLSKIDESEVKPFLEIISRVQNDDTICVERVEEILNRRYTELDDLRASNEALLKAHNELTESYKKIQESQGREIAMLKEKLTKSTLDG